MSGPDTVWCVQFIARPDEKADSPPDMIGAYANCWIRLPDREEAVRAAKAEVEAVGWRVEEMEFVDEVAVHNLPADARQYYDEARAQGSSIVFWGWTEEDAPDA